jgi:hypothetical protein
LTGLVNKGGDAQHLTKLTLKTPSNVTTALWDALTAYLRLEAPSSPLQELALVANGMSDNVVAWTAADLVPLLCLPTPTSNDDVVTPTVGSQIQSLSVSPRHSCLTGLYQGLADHAARIRIQKLNVAPTYWQTARENVASLALCIVKVSSLRHLEFVHFLDANGDLPATTVASLKESGHVQSVSANVQSKIVHAYCNRNRILAQLLLESSAAGAKNKSESPAATATAPVAHKPESMSLAKRTHSEMDGRSDKAADDESGGATTNSNKKLKLSLLPKLFKSAMQMPRLRPSMLTRTLLRLQESIVPTASSENKGALEMAS